MGTASPPATTDPAGRTPGPEEEYAARVATPGKPGKPGIGNIIGAMTGMGGMGHAPMGGMPGAPMGGMGGMPGAGMHGGMGAGMHGGMGGAGALSALAGLAMLMGQHRQPMMPLNPAAVVRPMPYQPVGLWPTGGMQPLQQVCMGLGWESTPGWTGPVDLDASCIVLGPGVQPECVYFGQLYGAGGAITHSGDNRTGQGWGDDEVIMVDLNRIPMHVNALVFTVTSKSGQPFTMVQQAYCHLYDAMTRRELVNFQLNQFQQATALVMCVLSREAMGWQMVPLSIFQNATSAPQLVPFVQQTIYGQQAGMPGAYPQPGMPQPGMPQPGMPGAYPQQGYPQPGMPQPGYPQPGYPQQPGYPPQGGYPPRPY